MRSRANTNDTATPVPHEASEEQHPIAFTQRQLNILHSTVIDKLFTEITAPWINWSCRTPEDFIEKFSQLAAHGIAAPTALLYFGLSLNDFKTGAKRWIFASAAWLVNYVQTVVVDQITISRYLNYINNLIQALRNGYKGLEKLIDIDELETIREKFSVGARNISYFVTTEAIKWTILYYASALPPSLAHQVDWLDSEDFVKFLQASIMFLLEPAVHDRIHDFRFPAFTDIGIVHEEIKQLRKTIENILRRNLTDAQLDLKTDSSGDELVKRLKQDSADFDLLPQTVNHSHNNISVLFSNRTFVIQCILAASLATFYGMANSGNYKATEKNANDPIEQRLGSIVIDVFFGLFMALRAADVLARRLSHRFGSYCRHEWLKLILGKLSAALAALTIGSTLSVRDREKIPLKDIFVIIGTIFDNTIFSWEESAAAEILHALRSKNVGSSRHKRAILSRFYHHFLTELGKLSDHDFVRYLDAMERKTACLSIYTPYFQKMFAWARQDQLTASQIIDTLSQPYKEAMRTINKSGQFGSKRKCGELGASMLAMMLVSAGFIPANNSVISALCQYVAPAIAVPVATGLLAIGWFGSHQEKTTPPLQTLLVENEEDTPDEVLPTKTQKATLHKTSIFSKGAQCLIALAFPFVLEHGSQEVARWVLTNIFGLSPDEADYHSYQVGRTVAAVGAAKLTHVMAIGMRR